MWCKIVFKNFDSQHMFSVFVYSFCKMNNPSKTMGTMCPMPKRLHKKGLQIKHIHLSLCCVGGFVYTAVA